MRTALRLAAGWAGVLAVILFAGTAEGALVPRTPQRIRTTSHAALVLEPKSAHGKSASAGKSGAAKGGHTKAAVGTGAAKAGAKGHAGRAKTQTREAKDSVKESRPREQAKRRRGRKTDEVDEPPVTMWRAKGKAAEGTPKTTQHEVADRQVVEPRALTVEDFEKAANGASESAAPADDVAAKNDVVKPLTKSAVRAANEKADAERAAAAEKAAAEKVAQADRLASKPVGERLPMMTPGAATKKTVVVRAPVKAANQSAVTNVPVKAALLPQVQANGPKAVVVARATALPRLEASSETSDAATVAPVVRPSGSPGLDEITNDTAPSAEIVRQIAPAQSASTRDTEFEDDVPVKRSLRMPTHEEMAEAAVQPVVLPGLYRDGRLVVPAPLKGTREILVHQNTMADAEGLERIRNENDLNRLRAMHELVDLRESESLRLNPELALNRRCARVWSVKFAEDMSRAFYARFHEPLQVNSAVRTVAFQVRLQRVNGNAAGIGGEAASPHLTGQALDFGKRGMSVEQIAWMRSYLLPLMQAGKVDVEEEFQQACFHISVYKSYLPTGPSRRRGVRTEVARLGVETKPVRVPPPTEDEQQ